MGMIAGTLDRRITLLRAGIVQNEGGDDVEGYEPLATVWASVRPSPGTERLQSAQNAASAPTVFRIRWSQKVSGLSPVDRVEYPVGSGRTFDIKSVVEMGRREGLEIAAIGSGQ
jgi:SPP1 family predicted phage head-tail adaptor